jgi:chromosome segregation ATPase
VENVSDEGQQPPEHEVQPQHRAPALPTAASAVSKAAPAVLPGVVDPDRVSERVKRILSEVFSGAPARFQQFLEQKAGLMEALADTVPAAGLEKAATKGALKTVKLTAAEIQQAVEVMQQHQSATRSEFDGALAQKREQKVTSQQEQIERTRTMLQGIDEQITRLQQQREELTGTIAPAEDAISQAEAELNEAEQIYAAADTQVAQYLANFGQQLLGAAPK